MADGNGFQKWIIGIASVLVTCGVAGSVGYTISTARAQGAIEVQVEVNKNTSQANAEAVKPIPVMAEQISDIKEDLGDLEEEIKDNHKEILEAINKK